MVRGGRGWRGGERFSVVSGELSPVNHHHLALPEDGVLCSCTHADCLCAGCAAQVSPPHELLSAALCSSSPRRHSARRDSGTAAVVRTRASAIGAGCTGARALSTAASSAQDLVDVALVRSRLDLGERSEGSRRARRAAHRLEQMLCICTQAGLVNAAVAGRSCATEAVSSFLGASAPRPTARRLEQLFLRPRGERRSDAGDVRAARPAQPRAGAAT